MLQLLEFLQELHPMSAELEQEVRRGLRVKELSKGRHWLRTGDRCNHIAFVEQGILKAYTDVNNRELVLWFHKELDVVIPGRSFFNEGIADLAVKALEHTKIWYIEHNELLRICGRHPAFLCHLVTIMERYYSASESHVILLNMPAWERYEDLTRRLPWLEERIHDKEIAAYLGITPSCLSMIKNGKVKRA